MGYSFCVWKYIQIRNVEYVSKNLTKTRNLVYFWHQTGRCSHSCIKICSLFFESERLIVQNPEMCLKIRQRTTPYCSCYKAGLTCCQYSFIFYLIVHLLCFFDDTLFCFYCTMLATGWPNKNRTFLRYHIFAATTDIIMRFLLNCSEITAENNKRQFLTSVKYSLQSNRKWTLSYLASSA